MKAPKGMNDKAGMLHVHIKKNLCKSITSQFQCKDKQDLNGLQVDWYALVLCAAFYTHIKWQ